MNMIAALRQSMINRGIAATVVPSTDPHGSEYVADHWQARSELSGFDGSAGTLVVTQSKAALWTDSRYFIQAADQLAGSGIELMRDGLPETPSVEEWLLAELTDGAVVALDAKMFSINAFVSMQTKLAQKGIAIATDCDLVGEVWTARPPMPRGQVSVFGKSGRSLAHKLLWFRDRMRLLDVGAFVVTTLDDIAWLLNIRGSDIDYNPVVVSYLYVAHDRAVLFVDDSKLNNATKRYFARNGIELADYGVFFDFLHSVGGQTVGVDFRKANYEVFKALSAGNSPKDIALPTTEAKAVKNAVELAGFRRAMVKDGVALVRFFMWLRRAVAKGEATELTASAMLHRCRCRQAGFVGESFETIAAYEAHGAIVHYSPTPQSDVALRPAGLFLLDSGGQYTDGTTDITRTVALGRLTREQKRDFTLVLKGMIALSQAIFPQGTRGAQLDVLARQYLWADLKNFGHGTGHGVGHYLCVHEGPQSIRMQDNPQPLLAGMVTSNEPAVYVAGRYGIRHENLIAVMPSKRRSAFGVFYRFETLTLFPFDRRGIDLSLMTADEIEWLNAYHRECYRKLSPHLDSRQKAWLRRMTKEIRKP